MKIRVLCLVLLSCVPTVGWPQPADGIKDLPDFLVEPIRTDAQRAFISNEASAYACVNCDALTSDDKLDLQKFNTKKFENRLRTLAASDPAQLKLILRYSLQHNASEPVKREIKATFTRIAKSAGFNKVRAIEMQTSAKWEDDIARVHTYEETDGISEPVLRSERIKVYPVRTKLLKFVLGDMDCVVEIRKPIDGRFRDLPEPLRAEIRQQVVALNLGDHKGRLLFDVSSTSAGQELIDTVFDSRKPPRVPPNVTDPALIKFFLDQGADFKPSPAMKFANELGFDSIRCRHTPGGGAPEKLIGQPAPDFTLPRLEGDELQLSAFINKRPALVTFWGVACGPCCVEAPHLTKLHEKYGADFAIVAVNGYNESRDVVAKFAEKTKLLHPIVLNGQSVADDLYQVGSYPTSFWINREGILEDYEVGFESADELEARVVRILQGE